MSPDERRRSGTVRGRWMRPLHGEVFAGDTRREVSTARRERPLFAPQTAVWGKRGRLTDTEKIERETLHVRTVNEDCAAF